MQRRAGLLQLIMGYILLSSPSSVTYGIEAYYFPYVGTSTKLHGEILLAFCSNEKDKLVYIFFGT